MVKDLFNVKVGTGEIYKAVAMPVITLKYADESKNISFGVIDLAGVVFIAKTPDSLKKLSDPHFLDTQIRRASDNSNGLGDSD
jgi:hypothetical protein